MKFAFAETSGPFRSDVDPLLLELITPESCCQEGLAAIELAVTAFRGDTALTDDFTITEMIFRGQTG